MTPRRPLPSEHAALARLWHEGWHEAHAAHVPAALTRLRTLADFQRRVPDMPGLRTIGAEGAPLGLCSVRGSEMHQLFVAPAARGTGAASALIVDAEARIAEAHERAWLDCVIENARARAFYERMGWLLARIGTEAIDTSEGPFPLRVAVYEKVVRPSSAFTMP